MKKSKGHIIIGFLAFFVSTLLGCKEPKPSPNPPATNDTSGPIYAWDLSTNAANSFWKIKDSNNLDIHLLDFAKQNHVNTVRLRLLNGNPTFPHPSIQQIIQTSQLCKEKSLQTWVDFHLSDVWADPGNQQIPASFKNNSVDSLANDVAQFIRSQLTILKENNVLPHYIQIGNEVSNGFLWPTCGFWKTATGFHDFKTVYDAAAEEVRKLSPETKIIFHLAGDINLYYTIEEVRKLQLDFDIWGFSYYGLWHGCEPENLFNLFENTAYFSGKPFMIAEIAYPFTLSFLDNETNVVGGISQLCSGYSAQAASQNNWLSKTVKILASKAHYKGIAYWEPAWLGKNAFQTSHTSSWENMCLFDFSGKPLPAAYGNWTKTK